jgi:hypothetical protein
MTLTAIWETEAERMESCDHAGTTEPLEDSEAISTCTECRKTWPPKFGAGAATLRIVAKALPEEMAPAMPQHPGAWQR